MVEKAKSPKLTFLKINWFQVLFNKLYVLITDQSNGYEQVEKLCADEERPGKIIWLSKLNHAFLNTVILWNDLWNNLPF